MRNRILVVGSSSLEFIQTTERFPYTDESIISKGSCYFAPGGRGAISALTFSRLGGESILATRVGADDNGARLVDMYKKYGIDTRFMSYDRDVPTSITSIRRNGKNEFQTIYYKGANNTLTAADVEDSFTCYPDAVYINFDIPAEAVYAASSFAAKKNIPVFIDAGPINKEISFESIPKVDVLIMDSEECYQLSSIKADTLENCLKACIKLAAIKSLQFIVIKLGQRGTFVYDNTLYNVIPSHKVETIDTSGVGDVFSAALTYAFMQKGNALESIRFASLAAAICVTRTGTFQSVPTLREIKQFAIKVKEADGE